MCLYLSLKVVWSQNIGRMIRPELINDPSTPTPPLISLAWVSSTCQLHILWALQSQGGRRSREVGGGEEKKGGICDIYGLQGGTLFSLKHYAAWHSWSIQETVPVQDCHNYIHCIKQTKNCVKQQTIQSRKLLHTQQNCGCISAIFYSEIKFYSCLNLQIYNINMYVERGTLTRM